MSTTRPGTSIRVVLTWLEIACGSRSEKITLEFEIISPSVLPLSTTVIAGVLKVPIGSTPLLLSSLIATYLAPENGDVHTQAVFTPSVNSEIISPLSKGVEGLRVAGRSGFPAPAK